MSTNTTLVGTDTDGANHQSNLDDRHVEILDNHRQDVCSLCISNKDDNIDILLGQLNVP